MNTPLFSIITPCYNAGEKLNRTLDSVLSQTFRDCEIIVKDAGSTDGCTETMRMDPSVRLVRCKDTGIYDGMNQALRSACGEYLLFLNCGDVLHDRTVLDAVARGIERDRAQCAEKQDGERQGGGEQNGAAPAGCIFYGDVLEMKTGQRVAANPQMTPLALYRNIPCHQACFYSRDLFRDRGFDTGYVVRADYEHFLWCVLKAGARTCALPVLVADYEGGGFSETARNRDISAKEHEEITARYFSERELRSFRRYMLLTLQPLREKLARSPYTAGLYDGIKSRVYRRQ